MPAEPHGEALALVISQKGKDGGDSQGQTCFGVFLGKEGW